MTPENKLEKLRSMTKAQLVMKLCVDLGYFETFGGDLGLFKKSFSWYGLKKRLTIDQLVDFERLWKEKIELPT